MRLEGLIVRVELESPEGARIVFNEQARSLVEVDTEVQSLIPPGWRISPRWSLKKEASGLWFILLEYAPCVVLLRHEATRSAQLVGWGFGNARNRQSSAIWMAAARVGPDASPDYRLQRLARLEIYDDLTAVTLVKLATGDCSDFEDP